MSNLKNFSKIMIDILLSTYNGEKYLAEQLESIVKQTYSAWTLYIRDDGSTDSTNTIIDNYCLNYTEKIKKISDTYDGNVGVVRSFELLLKQSNSEYIMFCDQDDVWLPEKVEMAITEIKKIESEKNVIPIIICSDLYVVDNKLNKISDSFWKYTRISPQYLQEPKSLATNNYVTGCTMLFNNKVKQISLPFGKYTTMHDAWIALKVLSSGGIIQRLPVSLIMYRQHEKNEIGAISISYNINYFTSKVIGIKTVLSANYKNYKQAKEILQISLFRFVYCKIKYLIKR